jgi:1-acyl-sn-glycerol-3-phosphate acyltransferase
MILLRSSLYHVFFYVLTALFASSSIVPRSWPGPFSPDWPNQLARAWARTMIWGMRVLCGLRYEVTGWENLPSGPCVIASMHQSAFDTLVWLLLVPHPAYVLKVELMRIPFFGGMCRLTGMIAVDRDAGGAAIRTMLRDADAVVAAGRRIVIFPEGTRAPPGRPGPLQPGIAALAAHCRLEVVPVLTDSGVYWGRRSYRRYPGVIRIAIQPKLPAGTPRRVLMAELEAQFARGTELARQAVDNSVGTIR